MPRNKEWTKAEMRRKLRNSNKVLARSIAALYNLQTQDERATKRTVKKNDLGFNSADAEFLTSLGEQAWSAYRDTGKFLLTTAQLDAAREPMLKYAGQLADVANSCDDITEVTRAKVRRS